MAKDRNRILQLLAIVSPIAIPLAALWLHDAGVVTIPWIEGGIVVFALAGLVCGLLWRSWWALAYLVGLWAIWGVIAIATDDDRYDPPAIAMVVGALVFAVAPAVVAAVLGIGLGRTIHDE